LKYISSTTNQQPFAVSYLINTLGFSPQAALSASGYIHFETPEKTFLPKTQISLLTFQKIEEIKEIFQHQQEIEEIFQKTQIPPIRQRNPAPHDRFVGER
jgi:mTERF domain-containing protein